MIEALILAIICAPVCYILFDKKYRCDFFKILILIKNYLCSIKNIEMIKILCDKNKTKFILDNYNNEKKLKILNEQYKQFHGLDRIMYNDNASYDELLKFLIEKNLLKTEYKGFGTSILTHKLKDISNLSKNDTILKELSDGKVIFLFIDIKNLEKEFNLFKNC